MQLFDFPPKYPAPRLRPGTLLCEILCPGYGGPLSALALHRRHGHSRPRRRRHRERRKWRHRRILTPGRIPYRTSYSTQFLLQCAFCNLRIAYLFFLSCDNILFPQACYVLHGPPARLDQTPRKPGRQPRKGGESGAENSKENEKSGPSSLPACLEEEPPLCAMWRKNAFNVIWGRLQRLIQVCPHCYSSRIGKLIYRLCGRGWS